MDYAYLAIWNARNKFIFEGHQDHPAQIFQTATTLLQDYQQITLRSRIGFVLYMKKENSFNVGGI